MEKWLQNQSNVCLFMQGIWKLKIRLLFSIFPVSLLTKQMDRRIKFENFKLKNENLNNLNIIQVVYYRISNVNEKHRLRSN